MPWNESLFTLFIHNPSDEYDFVLLPRDEDQDISSFLSNAFLLEEHKLAIATWILKPLFKEAKTAFMQAHQTFRDLQDDKNVSSTSASDYY